MDDLVYWSVNEVNKQNAGKTKQFNDWHVFHGVNPQYASGFNPGEYVEFTCANCGYSYEEPC